MNAVALKNLAICLGLSQLLSGCGGSADFAEAGKQAGHNLIPATSKTDPSILTFKERAAYYNVAALSNGNFHVSMRSDDDLNVVFSSKNQQAGTSNPGNRAATVLADQSIRALAFSDMQLNLAVHRKVRALNQTAPAQLIDLLNLYVLLLQRMPDPAGFEFWLDRLLQGTSIDEVAQAFLLAASQDSSLALPAKTSDAAFVVAATQLILGQTGVAPRQADLASWQQSFSQHQQRGRFINQLNRYLAYQFFGSVWLNILKPIKADLALTSQPINADNPAHKNLLGRYMQASQTLSGNHYTDKWYRGANFITAFRQQDPALLKAAASEDELKLAHRIFELQSFEWDNHKNFRQQCNNPGAEKTWVRSLVDSEYLWYKELVDSKPESYADASAYFDSLLIKSKDRFSFSHDTEEISNELGKDLELGYGWRLLRDEAQQNLLIAYVAPDSMAYAKGLRRGHRIIAINDEKVQFPLSASLQARLSPKLEAEFADFSVVDNAGQNLRRVPLQSAKVLVKSVPLAKTITQGNQTIGYLLFNSHSISAEKDLIAAVKKMQNEGISDLILDLRYNGGGYTYIANTLASMIGSSELNNKTFLFSEYNDKGQNLQELQNILGQGKFLEFDSEKQGLPRLRLRRLFVLTGASTCSASEALINGLSPFIEVIRIGKTTCGKPYGFFQRDNCGKSYFTISLKNLNAVKQANYEQGFTPHCSANEGYDKELGDPAETRLAAALFYAKQGSCPLTSSRFMPAPGASTDLPPLNLPQDKWRMNQFYR